MRRRIPLRAKTSWRRTPTATRGRFVRPGLRLDPGPGWLKLCEKILTRDGRQCRFCGGVDGQPVIDHLLPRRLFPSATQANAEDNLSVLCLLHHGIKTAEVERGLFAGDPYKLRRWLAILGRTGPIPSAAMIEDALGRLRRLLDA